MLYPTSAADTTLLHILMRSLTLYEVRAAAVTFRSSCALQIRLMRSLLAGEENRLLIIVGFSTVGLSWRASFWSLEVTVRQELGCLVAIASFRVIHDVDFDSVSPTYCGGHLLSSLAVTPTLSSAARSTRLFG